MRSIKATYKYGLMIVGGVVLVTASLINPWANNNETVKTGSAISDGLTQQTQAQPDIVSLESANSQGPSLQDRAAGPASPFKDFAYKGELQSYAILKKKIFLSDEDKANRQELLRNENFHRSLEAILKSPALDREAVALQNSALDFLLESLKGDLSGEAAKILKEVVANPAIEDGSIDFDSRQALAGVSAEVLFQWSAMDPSQGSILESLLPGPVSKQIWKNVKAEQANNLSESALEMKK